MSESFCSFSSFFIFFFKLCSEYIKYSLKAFNLSLLFIFLFLIITVLFPNITKY